MKKKQPKWLAVLRRKARDCYANEGDRAVFLAGAWALSEHLVSARVAKGGKARAKALTPERRSEIAQEAGKQGGRPPAR